MAQHENGQANNVEVEAQSASNSGEAAVTRGLWTPEIQARLDTELRVIGNPPGDIGTRVLRHLMREGAVTVRDALVVGSRFMRAIHNVGSKTVEDARGELGQFMPEIPFVDDPDPAFVAKFCPTLGQVTWLALGKGWSDRLRIYTDPGHPLQPSIQDVLDRPMEEVVADRIHYYEDNVDEGEFQIGVREAAAEYAARYHQALGDLGVSNQQAI